MKSDRRVVICCVVAWFCYAAVECHAELLDAGGNAFKEGNSTEEEDRPENGVNNATNIHEDLLVKSLPGVILKDTGDEDALKKCDCGPNSTSCHFGNGEKECECKEGYTNVKGWCKDPFEECEDVCGLDKGVFCDIGINHTLCRCEGGKEFDYKIKRCRNPFEECEKICGLDKDVSCEIKENHFLCHCKEGKKFDYKIKECRKCYCGSNSTSCHFDNGEKKCGCEEGFQEINGRCEGCYCGPNSTSCHFDNGEKKCECKLGYKNIKGWCKDPFEECEDVCGLDKDVSCEITRNQTLCHCEEGKEFDYEIKKCRNPFDECEEICGLDKDVSCEIKGNRTFCHCKEGKEFDYKIKKCRSDKCYEKCGVIRGKVHDGVQCLSDPFGDVYCICLDDSKKFDPDVRKCRGKEAETDLKAVHVALILGACLAIVLIVLFIVLWKMNKMKKNLI